MKKVSIFAFSLTLLVVLFTACKEKIDYEGLERASIDTYITGVLPDTQFVVKSSGLYFYEINTGTGESPDDQDIVFFKYKGRFITNYIFEYSYPLNKSFESVIGTGALIPGIDEALRLMKPGGKSKIITPSDLAFGKDGYRFIPPYSPLLWDLQLDSIRKVK